MSTALDRPPTRGVALLDLVRQLQVQHDLTGAACSDAEANPLVFGVTLDSRTVSAGDLYAALPGFNAHGADFVAQAAQRGAVAVLTDTHGRPQMPPDLPVVVVEHPRDVLGALASTIYGHPSSSLTMIGITGTNGKTTTAYLLESALRAHGRRTGLIGTVETRIGDEVVPAVRTTPEATDLHALLAVMRERGLDTCVMEVSSHALSLHRVDAVAYDVALFTNLTQDHLDFHDDMEHYYQAKASLFTPDRARAAVIVVDDAWGARLAAEAAEAGLPVSTLSTRGASAHWTVSQEGADGRFTLSGVDGARMHLRSHLTGTFNVANTALAALALLRLGLPLPAIEKALGVPPDVPGRMQVVVEGCSPSPHRAGTPRCIVDFAHTPDAVEAALLALRPSTPGRLVAVLGAGGDRDRGKRFAMGAAAARHADVVVVTDDNPRSEDPALIRAALLAGARSVLGTPPGHQDRLFEVGGRADAIATAVRLTTEAASRPHAATAGPTRQGIDTVVVLGKGHEKGQQIGDVVHPFDDRDAVVCAVAAVSTASGAPE